MYIYIYIYIDAFFIATYHICIYALDICMMYTYIYIYTDGCWVLVNDCECHFGCGKTAASYASGFGDVGACSLSEPLPKATF